MIPNFLIGGPPKCASTSLYFYLSQHPEIFMSPEKQTKFFSIDYNKGFDFYFQTYFSGRTNEKAVGESTPTYFLLPYVIERIRNFNPEMKFIFCFRNPVDRAFSGWNMRCNQGTENLSFRAALEQNIRQRESLSYDSPDMEKVWIKDQLHGAKNPGAALRNYIEGGLYAYNLGKYYEAFPTSQIHTFFFESIVSDLEGSLKNIYSFLGVNEDFKIKHLEPKNTLKKSRISFLDPIIGNNKPLPRFFNKITPPALKKRLVNTVYKKGPRLKLSNEDRLFAYEIFEEDMLKLEKMLKVDLSHWRPN